MSNPTLFVVGFDPTSSSQVTGAQLAQMVNAAQFASGYGGNVVTTDVAGVPVLPNVSTYPILANFQWIRISPTTNSISTYVWNPNQTYVLSYTGGSVNTFWNPVTTGNIPAGSIQGYQLAPATVTFDKINTIQISQVTGFTPANYVALSTNAPSGLGTINGNFTAGLFINNGGVTTAMIANNAVTTALIAANNVTVAKILGGTLNQVLMTVDNANSTNWQMKSVLTANEPASAGQVPISTGANAYGALAIANSSSFGRILQQIAYYDTQTGLSDTTHMAVGTMPTFASGTLYGNAGTPGTTTPTGSSGLISPITPKSSTSIIRIEVYLKASTVTGADYIALGLFKDIMGAKFSGFSASTPAIAATAKYNGNGLAELYLLYEMTSLQTTEIDFGIRFGSPSHTTKPNVDANTASFFGGSGAGLYSWIKITEYI